MDLELISKLATEFRNSIEQLEFEEYGESCWFSDFPRGCCGDTSDLFIKHLKQYGVKSQYVWGMRGKQSHAWIEIDGLIIDLTADQFEEIKVPIMVTFDQSMHSSFTIRGRRYEGYDEFDDYNSKRLSFLYNNIVKKITMNTKCET